MRIETNPLGDELIVLAELLREDDDLAPELMDLVEAEERDDGEVVDVLEAQSLAEATLVECADKRHGVSLAQQHDLPQDVVQPSCRVDALNVRGDDDALTALTLERLQALADASHVPLLDLRQVPVLCAGAQPFLAQRHRNQQCLHLFVELWGGQLSEERLAEASRVVVVGQQAF